MNGLKIFLTTKIENQGTTAGIGDFFLTPARYLWNGKNVQVIIKNSAHDGFSTPKIKHVKSFPETSYLKTTLAISLLIPGLFVGVIFKGISLYFSETALDYLGLVKDYFTISPERRIGEPDYLLNKETIIGKIEERKRRTINQKIDHFVVYGQNVEFDKDPGLFGFRARKFILVGVKFAKNLSFQEEGYPKLVWNTTMKTVEEAIEHAYAKEEGKKCVGVYLIPAQT